MASCGQWLGAATLMAALGVAALMVVLAAVALMVVCCFGINSSSVDNGTGNGGGVGDGGSE